MHGICLQALVGIALSIFCWRNICKFFKCPVKSVQSGKATVHGNGGDILVTCSSQKLFGVFYPIKSQKLPELYTCKLMQRVRKVFFVITEYLCQLGKGYIFCVMLRKIGDDFPVKNTIAMLGFFKTCLCHHLVAEQIQITAYLQIILFCQC